MRFIYALLNGIKYRKHIHSLATDQSLVYDSVLDIKPEDISAHILALDFDGVLNSHGELLPRSDVVSWLKNMCDAKGSERIVILSNKPLQARLKYFGEHFKGVDFVRAPRKKPYPDGLLAIARQKNVSSDDIVLVDDRLLTGILATIIAGTKGIYINKPYIQYRKRPVQEAFFKMLRVLERLILL